MTSTIIIPHYLQLCTQNWSITLQFNNLKKLNKRGRKTNYIKISYLPYLGYTIWKSFTWCSSNIKSISIQLYSSCSNALIQIKNCLLLSGMSVVKFVYTNLQRTNTNYWVYTFRICPIFMGYLFTVWWNWGMKPGDAKIPKVPFLFPRVTVVLSIEEYKTLELAW